MPIVHLLKRLKESESFAKKPLLKRFVSLIVDYDTETYEMFNYGMLLLWGLWVMNPQGVLVSPAIKVITLFIPAFVFGIIAFCLGIAGLFALSKYINESQGIVLRKNCMFISAMFLNFIFFMNVIYSPTSTATPIYFCLTIFGFWQCLRLKSLEWDLKHGTTR